MTDAAALWLPLLRQLTDACPGWLVWKNADEALAGKGDIDSAATPAEVPQVSAVFASWAGSIGAEGVFVCRHIPGKHLLFAALDTPEPRLLELDVMMVQPFRAAPLVTADVLPPLSIIDPRGFRRLRPGAEALLLAVLNGIGTGGRPNSQAIQAKSLPSRLAGDPEGVEGLCARLPGRRARLVRRVAHAVALGGWDRRAAVGLEMLSIVAATMRPAWSWNRIKGRVKGGRVCTLTAAAMDGRTIRGDFQLFLERAQREHPGVVP
jgi:hypothetical protein